MDTTLFNKNGEAVAYITVDFNQTIFLWEGLPVAYLFNEEHVYGINGRHLGWFRDGVLYNNRGERVGFTFDTCPARVAKEPVKGKKRLPDQMRPRWAAPPSPKLTFNLGGEDLPGFLKEGEIPRYREEAASEEEEPQD
jgi:hypothetical protein